MNRTFRLWPLLALWLVFPAAAVPVQAEHVEAELVAERNGWLPGAENWVALRLKPEAGWHTYWRNPGDSGLPTSLAWTLPETWKAGGIQWPYPEPHRLGELVNYGYGEETFHLVPIVLPPKVAGAQATVRVLAKWLVCADICIPGKAELELTLPVTEIATADPRWEAGFEEARRRLPRAERLLGTFAVADGELHLQVEAGSGLLSDVSRAEFFVGASNLVNHGAPQRVAVDGDAVRFSQPLSSFFTDAPGAVEGVLVLHGPAVQSYTVNLALAPAVAAVPPQAAPEPAPAVAPPAPATAAPGLLAVLAFAVLGGLILNLMPCVFPVLSIKAVSVLETRAGDPAGERRHALAYTAGVVLSCLVVATVLLALRAGGQALGWGFQLQSPVFVTVLVYLLFMLGLSLSGVVEFGTRLMGVGQSLTESGGYAGTFFAGVLATVVASPCTAPFMGTSLGFALTQPAPVALLVFAALGLGLALPFLLLGFFPPLGKWLPRPGAWMETFKQVMAFPLYLTVVWLLWVLGRQTDMNGVAVALAGLVLIAFALWAWGSPQRGAVRTVVAVAVGMLAVGLLAHPALKVSTARPAAAASAETEPWSERRLQQLRLEGHRVFVNFTADWCITCKVNEKAALESDAVRKAFADRNVAWLVADWTRADPAITAALARFGRSGVPLYLLYPPTGEPVVLPQILTPGAVLEAVENLP